MKLHLAALLTTVTACAEPIVEMEIVLPSNAEAFDSSCVTAVGAYAFGANFMQDDSDYVVSCQEITPQSRLAGIHDEIRGKYTLTIPDSGLSGVQIFGWSGPAPCDAEFQNDLIFEGSDAFIGQDKLVLELDTTLDCAKQPVNVKPVGLFSLISGATPSSDNCTTALVPTTDDNAYTSLGQIREREFGTAVDYFGGIRGATVQDGLATFTAGTTGMSGACLAYDTYGNTGYGTSCTIPGGKVCAGTDELDAPFIEQAIANSALVFDEALLAKWDSIVFVSVWNNASPKKAPIAGATLELAANKGQIVYVDPPAPGSTQLVRRTDNATGPSGLALVFTNRLANVTVNAGGASREVVVAAPDWSFGAALVVMP